MRTCTVLVAKFMNFTEPSTTFQQASDDIEPISSESAIEILNKSSEEIG